MFPVRFVYRLGYYNLTVIIKIFLPNNDTKQDKIETMNIVVDRMIFISQLLKIIYLIGCYY